MNWKVGDKIGEFTQVSRPLSVISSTDFAGMEYFPEQSEVRTIAAVNGANVTLQSGLTFTHWGQDYEKAEVG